MGRRKNCHNAIAKTRDLQASVSLQSSSGDQSDPLTDDTNILKTSSHFLTIPLEIRDRIYDYVRNGIWNSRSSDWFKNPVTEYHGLRLSCRQLYQETKESIFQFQVSHKKVRDLCQLPGSKLNFRNARSLSLEIKFDQLSALHCGLASTLDTIQLSLQELRLSFTGSDRSGTPVFVHGCGNLDSNREEVRCNRLLVKNQYLRHQLDIFRQLTILRNLRVLVINNANMPLFQSMFLCNKQHLQALQILSDPRSPVHCYEGVRGMKDILKALLVNPTRHFPPIKVLNISANAVLLSSTLAMKTLSTLEHLTYSVPDNEMASCIFRRSQLGESVFLIRALRRGAPNLKTFRLCIGGKMTEESSDMCDLIGSLKADLLESSIENLEVHAQSTSPFFQKELVQGLPHRLRRLYVSSRTLHISTLVEQIEQRYLRIMFHDPPVREQWNHTPDFYRPPFCGLLRPNRQSDHSAQEMTSCNVRTLKKRLSQDRVSTKAIYIQTNYLGQVTYGSQPNPTTQNSIQHGSFVCERIFKGQRNHDGYLPGAQIGEASNHGAYETGSRQSGYLGFVGFDLDSDENHENNNFENGQKPGDHCEFGVDDETHKLDEPDDIIKILRLNGRLLDREHNMHFIEAQIDEFIEKFVRPKWTGVYDALYQIVRPPSYPESAFRSNHLTVACGLHAMEELHRPYHEIEAITSELAECWKDDHTSEWADYFGDEDLAKRFFEHEKVAKIEDQRPKPMPAIVDYKQTNKCQWMAPEYKVPPVGSWPEPPMPTN